MRLVTTSLCAVGIALLVGQYDSQSAEPSMPSVELNYNGTRAGDWTGRRFREIIPASEVRRIIRLKGLVFGGETAKQIQQRYDSLLSHLHESDERAGDYLGRPNEAVSDQLLVVTKAGTVYLLEVRNFRGVRVSAVTIKGPGQAARIAVKGDVGEEFAFGGHLSRFHR